MKTTIVALLALVLGVVLGAVGAMKLATGPMLGTGIGTGLATGICMVVQASKSAGLLTDEEIGAVLAQATKDFGGSVPEGTDLSTAVADCEATMAKLKSGG